MGSFSGAISRNVEPPNGADWLYTGQLLSYRVSSRSARKARLIARPFSFDTGRMNKSMRLCRFELVTGHLLGIAGIEPAVGDHGMIPGLPLERLKAPQFFVPFWIGGQQNGFAGLRQDQQHSLVRQEHDLAAAVAARLPATFSGGQVDAAEILHVKTISMGFMHHQVGEFGAQILGRPNFLWLPGVSVRA